MTACTTETEQFCYLIFKYYFYFPNHASKRWGFPYFPYAYYHSTQKLSEEAKSS
jgi:hypothetical protein